MKIHHIGYAVKTIEPAKKQFQLLGYDEMGSEVIDEKRGVTIQFMRKDFLLVELIAPIKDNSPVFNYLKKMGPAPYHICYEVENLDAQTVHFRSLGFTLLEKPSNAPAINEKRVAFLYQKDIGLIEFVEK